jgi:HNH endonuclease
MVDDKIRYHRRLKGGLALEPGQQIARYHKFSIRRASGEHRPGEFDISGGGETEDVSSSPLPNTINFSHRIKLGDARKVVGRFGFCIYCGSSTHGNDSSLPPADEHIIPEGLGGNLVLENSSCQRCADNINSYEGRIQRTLFQATRRNLSIRGKRRKAPLPLTVSTDVDGELREIELPLHMHPSVLLMPKLRLPGLMEIRPDYGTSLATFWFFTFDHERAYGPSSPSKWITPELDMLGFAQLLSKIAYTYLVSISPISEFTLGRIPIVARRPSSLSSFVKHKFSPLEYDNGCFSFVGGSNISYEPSQYLHELGHGVIENNGTLFEVVYIRLFANLGTPLYLVVVNYNI